MVIRFLSPSKLKRLLPASLCSNTYTVPASNIFLHQTSPYFLNPDKTLSALAPSVILRPFSAQPRCPFPALPISRDGNYDEASSEILNICPGCGVPMQDTDSKKPGFYVKPSIKKPNYKTPIDNNPVAEESEISASLKKGFLELENREDPLNTSPSLPPNPTVCSRCHSLRYYGKVKDSSVENLLPDFDFDHTVGRRLSTSSGPRTVVLMVVDAVDFDGSFPRAVARLVSNTIDENSRAWKEGKPGNVPRVVLVVTKIDLLPSSSMSPTGFEHWVRTRAREGGAIKLASVHLVSAVKNWGLKNLVDDVMALAGARGHVWAVGAQNAGKSTLINAIGKCVGGNVTHLTEAPVPGTTLGIIRVEGLLSGHAKLFDTPGLLHPHQLTTRLNREEQKLVHISKELKPRTYRIKVGHSVHIAGLMRLDIEESSVDSIYVTVWASPYLPLHMGKTEKVLKMWEDHFGYQLKPPNEKSRVEELGKWVRKEFHVNGNSWDSSSVDIAAAGIGWFAIGLKGEAQFGVWTYDGVSVISRNALIRQRSNNFEVAGFTVSQIVSIADRVSNKQSKMVKKKKISNLTLAVGAETGAVL